MMIRLLRLFWLMIKRGNINRLNNNNNKNETSDKDHMIPKEACVDLNPESKEFGTLHLLKIRLQFWRVHEKKPNPNLSLVSLEK